MAINSSYNILFYHPYKEFSLSLYLFYFHIINFPLTYPEETICFTTSCAIFIQYNIYLLKFHWLHQNVTTELGTAFYCYFKVSDSADVIHIRVSYHDSWITPIFSYNALSAISTDIPNIIHYVHFFGFFSNI